MTAGFVAGALSPNELRILANKFRTDEFIVGTVVRAGGGVRVRSELVLARDERMIQPLPMATGSDPDRIADQIAKSIGNASAVGPILLGVGKPVAAMQNEATVEEIVNMTSHVVLKAQQAAARREALRA